MIDIQASRKMRQVRVCVKYLTAGGNVIHFSQLACSSVLKNIHRETAQMATCPNCGGGLRPGMAYCVKCGSAVEVALAAPPIRANAPLPQFPTAPPPLARHGIPQLIPAYQGPLKSKIAAGLLALFLGCFGVHNFYLGHTGRGVAQLLITILGACLYGLGPIAVRIWSFVEMILIFTGGIRDSYNRPLA